MTVAAVTAAPCPAQARSDRLATLAFAALLVFGFVLILIETRGLSFYSDEWDFLLDRNGMSAHVLLTPHGPHLSIIPILIYKVLLHLFGASSYFPFRCLAAVDLVLVASVVGLICRREWGAWWGLVPAALLVALGPGYPTLTYPFQVGYTLAVVGGLFALSALRRHTAQGDLIACVGLLVSLASASQGVAFVIGAGCYLVISDRSNLRIWVRRSWVIIVPGIAYLIWYLAYGKQASDTDLSLWTTTFAFTVNGLAATLSGIFALTGVGAYLLNATPGWPILIAALFALIIAARRGWRPSSDFWGPVFVLGLLFFMTATSNTPASPRAYNDPRYLSTNATMLMILACTAIPRPSLRRSVTTIIVLLVGIIAILNIAQYAVGRAALMPTATYARAETRGLLIMRGVVAPEFNPSTVAGNPGRLQNVEAGRFFSAYDAFGTFLAYSPSQLQHASAPVRAVVDEELSSGERLHLRAVPRPDVLSAPAPVVLLGAHSTHGDCVGLTSTPLTFRGSAGSYVLTASRRHRLTIHMARFAASDSVLLGSALPGRSVMLSIPKDEAPSVPWRVELAGSGGQACRSEA